MPLSRYQIRNEYSLADPELYRTADKDDPEAVLEGIAMAGLVGVLRQLGDLAEFAAEIFHDLHEQVMVTASRGHNLMVRVQQLEVEFPAIEKALLCQTSHSSFYYNAGTDWHPNLRMDHNLITEGDLPRFVMDSYEECRGPPRLFLLDKFDVAGDGATLKRYTDPSFFKVEASFFNVVRDKKIRKAKRKASRWRKGETPETLPTSHAKLHQLFMEERLENGTTHSSTSRVKLKRRLNGFPFDTKSGKSYMEKFLKSPSPNHDEVHEISEDLSPLSFPSNNDYQSALEVVEISASSPEKESKQRIRNLDSPPAREETALALVADELNEVSTGEDCLEVSEPNLGLQLYGISSTSHAVLSERDITVDGESKMEDSINDNQSDDVASEIDNFVDALASMDSENDTDSELRTKSNLHFMSSRDHPSGVDAEDVQVQAHSADSVSVGNSTLSDDGSSSSKKDLSSFYSSDTHSTSAENIPDAEDTLNVQASDIHIAEPSQLPENSASSGPNESGSPNDSVLVDENAEVIVEDTTSVGIERDAMVTFSRDLPFISRYTDVCNPSGSPSDSVFVDENAKVIVEDTTSVGIERDAMANFSRDLPFISRYTDVCNPSGSPNDSVLVDENAEVIVEDTTSVGIERDAMVTFSRDLPFISRYTDACNPSGEYLSPILPGESLDDLHESATKIDVTSTYHSIPSSPSRQTSPLQVPGEKQFIGGDEIAVASTADGFISPGTTDDRNSSDAETPPLNELVDVENSAVAINHAVGHLHKRDDESTTSSSCNLSQGGFGVEGPNYDLDVSDGIMEVAAEKPNSENELDYKIQFPQVDGNLDENIVGSQNSDLPLSRGQLRDPINKELDTGYSTTVVGERVSEEDNSTLLAGEINPCNSRDEEAYVEEHEMKERTLNLIDEFCDVPSNVVDGAIVATSASDTTAGTVLMAEVHVQADGVDHESVITASTISSNDGDESVKKVHEEYLSSILDEHSGVANDTSHSSKPLESEVLDDAHQLQGMGMDDDLGLQVCNDDDDIYNRSGVESGVNIDEASTTKSSSVQYEQSPLCVGVEIDLQPRQMSRDLHSKSDDNFSALPLAHVPHSNGHLEMSDDTSEFLQKNLSGPSSESEQLSLDGSKIDVSEQHVDLSNPISLSPPLPPDSDPIHAEDAPPLPPLPPVQWWLGDNQNACPVQESILVSGNATAFSPPLSSSVNEEAQHANPFLPQASLSDVNLSEQPVCSTSSLLSTIPPLVHHGDEEDTLLPMERLKLTGSVTQSPESPGEILHNNVQDDEGGEVERNSEVHLMDSAKSIRLFGEEFVKPLNQTAVETNSSGLEHGLQSAHSEEIVATHVTTKTSATMVNDGLGPTLEESVSQPINGGMQNGSRTTKPPLPRNPLIDAIADVAHDKSKLRKVPERVQPLMKGEEKSSMLAQIRNQSFNLKRAPATRANVQGPPVNLNVVSLMSKVNKVLLTNRQAMAGSDDEDDDWDP